MYRPLSLLATLVIMLTVLSGCHSSRKAAGGTSATQSRSAIVKEAHKWLGTKYKYGGIDRSGVDCSGMVMRVYDKAAGVKLPRSSAQQREFCKSIRRKDLAAGDLLFFATGRDKTRVSHVGIYIGDGKMIHASTSKGVITSSLNEKYYVNKYHSSGRVTASSKRANREHPSMTEPTQELKKPDVPSIRLEDLISRDSSKLPTPSAPQPHVIAPARPAAEAPADTTVRPMPSTPAGGQILDDVIEQKIDSIYGSWMD